MDKRFEILFEPIKIGPVIAPNRFFAVPHATGHGWTQPAAAIALRAMKAEGGWGTVAVQMTEIAADSDMANHPMERIWDDSDIPRHAAQVEAIRQHGSLAAIELAHGGMRARNLTTGIPAMGPGHLPVLRPEVPAQARAMDIGDIRKFRNSHKRAVKRAISAGYDIIYVYASHDLSIFNHFLSRRTNLRTDCYGGCFENRLRLLREVLEDTLEAVEGNRAVALRFSVAEPDAQTGCLHANESREVVEALADLPDLWDVNVSGWENDSATARFADEGHQLRYTDFVKTVTSRPVVGVGRFTSPDQMAAVLHKNRLDLIGAARPSIADPFLPNKIKSGEADKIRECIGCNVCVSMDSYGLPIRCTQNPTISEEWRRDWHPSKPPISRQRRSHLIIGAGPAGLECAVTLMHAGQRVTVAESSHEAGGRVTREARLPGLASWARIRDHRLYLISQSSGIELFLNSPMTAKDVIEFGADTVTLATGSAWRRDGVGSTNMTPVSADVNEFLTPDDIMNETTKDMDPACIVVYDDDHFYMASVVAENLTSLGHHVNYLTPLPNIAAWTEHTLEYNRIVARFRERGIAMHPNTKLEPDGRFKNVLTGTIVKFDEDATVFVGARKPNDKLHTQLMAESGVGELFRAGDCVVPGIIQAAVLSGHTTARAILDPASSDSTFLREQLLTA